MQTTSKDIPPTDLFKEQVEQIYAAKVREAIVVEFYLHFLRAVGHTEKAYIMDGFSATVVYY